MQAYGWLLASFVLVFILAWFGECLWWWPRARIGAGVKLSGLVHARLRGIPSRVVVESMMLARAGGVELSLRDIETFHVAGFNVLRGVASSVTAQKAGLDFSFRRAAAFGLMGRDPLREVSEMVQADQARRQADALCLDVSRTAALTGMRGLVEHAVAPPGLVRVQDVMVGAVSQGGFIDKGVDVEVVSMQGNIAVVRAAKEK